MPPIRIDQLRGISEEILAQIPVRVARHCQAVPFAATSTEIDVATLDVRDLGLLDELAFCTGKRVQPYIANEARIFEALEKYYGVECPRRYGHLLDRLNRSRYLWDERATALMKPDAIDPSAEPLWADAHKDLDDRRPIRPAAVWNTQEFAVPGEMLSPVPDHRRGSLSMDGVLQLLSEEADRERIGDILLRFMESSFDRSALFKVRRGIVRGWMARGTGIESALFRALSFGLDQPSVFLNLHHGADFYLGPLPPMAVHLELARTWGGDMPRQCLLVPLRIRGRLVCALYGDCGDSDLGHLALDPFRMLARKAELALERCILEKKIHVA